MNLIRQVRTSEGKREMGEGGREGKEGKKEGKSKQAVSKQQGETKNKRYR